MAYKHIDYFATAPLLASTALTPAVTANKKIGVSTIVSVAVAVAMPYAAPALASSLGLSAALGNAALASGIVGAGMGGLAAAATGGNPFIGALTGGAGGFIGGGGLDGMFGADGVFGSGTGDIGLDGAFDGGGGFYGPEMAAAPAVTGTGVAPTGIDSFALNDMFDTGGGFYGPEMATTGPGAGLNTAVAPSLADQLSNAPLDGFSPPDAYGVAGRNLQIAGGQPAAGLNTSGSAGSFLDKVKTKIGDVGTELGKQFTDPKQLAKMTLQAGAQIAGGLLAPGASPEELAALAQMRSELTNLRTMDKAMFDKRLAAAQALLDQADQYTPDYYGREAAAQQQVRSGVAARDALRAISPYDTGKAQAETRRAGLQTARDVGASYLGGYGAGLNQQTGLIKAGLDALPKADINSVNGSANLFRLESELERRRREASAGLQSNLGVMFGVPGGFTTPTAAKT